MLDLNYHYVLSVSLKHSKYLFPFDIQSFIYSFIYYFVSERRQTIIPPQSNPNSQQNLTIKIYTQINIRKRKNTKKNKLYQLKI